MTPSNTGGSKLSIVQYWHSETMPAEVAELVATFGRCNPGLRHLVFCEAEAEEFIATHYTDREVAAFRSCAVPAMQADYFRYCATLRLGGVYADVAFRCLQPLQGLVETTTGGRLFELGHSGILINGFFLFRYPGHPLLRLALEVATTNIEWRAAERVQMVTGPWIFSALSLLRRLGSDLSLAERAEGGGLEALAGPFRRQATRMMPVVAGCRAAVPQMVEPILHAVHDYARLTAAFDGIRVVPLESITAEIRGPENTLHYKRGDTYWINWQKGGQTIFR